MIEITRMYHTNSGEIVFEDAQSQWWKLESFNPEVGSVTHWEPVVATKTDKPEEI